MAITMCPNCAAALSEFIKNGTTQVEKQKSNSPTLGAAITQVVTAKEQAGRRKRTTVALRRYLNQFARGREDTPLDQVDVDTLEAWFLIRDEKPISKLSNIGRLSTLFSFAVRRGWMQSNPCNRLEKPFVDRNPPRILTVAECEMILKWARHEKPVILAWVVLTLLVGLRPEAEADKVQWDAVDLENNRLIIRGSGSKVRSFRVIDLNMTPAVPWLKLAKENGAKLGLSTKARTRYSRLIRQMLGWWEQDCFRHAAASYLLGHHADDTKVSTMLGTSRTMLHGHYKSLVTSEAVAQYMALRPA
jgi:site-specific recombinase XerD